MSPAAFAYLLEARPAGRNKWQARCPAHPDRSLSLTIREGAEDRVLLHCFAGCQTSTILAALGLTMRDLFNDAPMDPRVREKVRREALKRETAARKKAIVERRIVDIHRRFGYAVDSLGSSLARLPDGPEADALAAVFHRSSEMQGQVQSTLGTYGAVKAPAKVTFVYSPFSGYTEEQLEAKKVTTEAGLLRYVGTGQARPVLAMKPERERPSVWQWQSSRPPNALLDDIIYEAALDTLEEFEALRGASGESNSLRTTQDPVTSGALRSA